MGALMLPVRMKIDRGCLLLACLPGRRNYKGKSKGKPPSGEPMRQGHLRPPPRTPCLGARPANHSPMYTTCQFASSRQSQGLPGPPNYFAKSERALGMASRDVPTRCRRGRVVAAARPCHYRQPAHHSHTIGWVSSYTLVCWVPISRRCRGRTGGRSASIAPRLAAFLNQSPRVCGRRRGFPSRPIHPALGRWSLSRLG